MYVMSNAIEVEGVELLVVIMGYCEGSTKVAYNYDYGAWFGYVK